MKRPWYKGFLPGWIVSGGGGGLATVSVTARLTGNGTGASPLDIASWPLILWDGPPATLNISFTQNQIGVFGWVLPSALTFSKITVRLGGAADAANNYDIGIYNKAGTRIANIGAQTLPTQGAISFTFVQGSQTIPPGAYVFAITSAAAAPPVTIEGTSQGGSWLTNATYAASAGGALPATLIAFPTVPDPNNSIIAAILS